MPSVVSIKPRPQYRLHRFKIALRPVCFVAIEFCINVTQFRETSIITGAFLSATLFVAPTLLRDPRGFAIAENAIEQLLVIGLSTSLYLRRVKAAERQKKRGLREAH